MRPEHHISVTVVGKKGIYVSFLGHLLLPVPVRFHASGRCLWLRGRYGQHRHGVKVGVSLWPGPCLLSQDPSPTQSPPELELTSGGLRPRLRPGSQEFREANGVMSWELCSTCETPSVVPPTSSFMWPSTCYTCSTEVFQLPNSSL